MRYLIKSKTKKGPASIIRQEGCARKDLLEGRDEKFLQELVYNANCFLDLIEKLEEIGDYQESVKSIVPSYSEPTNKNACPECGESKSIKIKDDTMQFCISCGGVW